MQIPIREFKHKLSKEQLLKWIPCELVCDGEVIACVTSRVTHQEPPKPEVVETDNNEQEIIPYYNSAIHKAGTKVRVVDNRGRVTIQIVPEIDGEGNPIP